MSMSRWLICLKDKKFSKALHTIQDMGAAVKWMPEKSGKNLFMKIQCHLIERHGDVMLELTGKLLYKQAFIVQIVLCWPLWKRSHLHDNLTHFSVKMWLLAQSWHNYDVNKYRFSESI